MSEPFGKQALLDRIREAHTQLVETVDQVKPAQLSEPSLADGWSVKDVLVHITWWEQHMIRAVQRALRGEPPQHFKHPDETIEQAIDRVNAEVFAANRDRLVADILMDRQRSFTNVLAMIDELGDDDAIDPAPIEARLGRELVRLIAGDTYNHYAEHERTIRARLAQTPGNHTSAGASA